MRELAQTRSHGLDDRASSPDEHARTPCYDVDADAISERARLDLFDEGRDAGRRRDRGRLGWR